MQFRDLGATGIRVSSLAFGAGPVPALMTQAAGNLQRETLRRALDAGINWIDTAATYGNGQSESALGRLLAEWNATGDVHLATKVRLDTTCADDFESQIRRSLATSCERLGVEQVTLVQLHNSITQRRNDEPTSLTPEDVLGSGGILTAFRNLQNEGRAQHLGLTGIGQAEALRQVINSGEFATIQVPYNLLNPSAGQPTSLCHAADAKHEVDYGNVIADCVRQNMGVFAIRVFAGGALAGQPPSEHTYRTKFFPLDLYQRDLLRAENLSKRLGPGADLRELATRFVLSHPHISSAIIGFGAADHVNDAIGYLEAGPLPANMLEQLATSDFRVLRS